MGSVEKQIDKQLNIIIDRYLKLKTPIKNIKKYLTGKNIKTIIDELVDLEDIYIKRYKNKTGKDFKNFVKQMIIKILKDRDYDIKDTSESLKHIKLFEEFNDEDWDWDEESPKIGLKIYTYDWSYFVEYAKNNGIVWSNGNREVKITDLDDEGLEYKSHLFVYFVKDNNIIISEYRKNDYDITNYHRNY